MNTYENEIRDGWSTVNPGPGPYLIDIGDLDYGDVDIDRLRRVIKQIDAEPGAFDMGNWALRVVMVTGTELVDGELQLQTSCKTTMCLAGHVVHDGGIGLQFTEEVGSCRWTAAKTTDGRDIVDVATELLRMPIPAARKIFWSTYIRTADELWDFIEEMTKGKLAREDRV